MKELLRRCLKAGLRPTVREEVKRRMAVLESELTYLTRLEILDRVSGEMDAVFERAKEMAAPNFPGSERMKVVREVIDEVFQEFRAKMVN